MPTAISRNVKHRLNRRKNLQANQPQPVTPILISAVESTLTIMTVTFDQPISLVGVPAYTTDLVGPHPLSAVKTGPNVIVITWSATVATAASLDVGYQDPAVRNASGGYVTSKTHML